MAPLETRHVELFRVNHYCREERGEVKEVKVWKETW